MNQSWMALSGLLCTTATAQVVNPTVNLDVETRIDYQQQAEDGSLLDDNSSFKGKYLNLKLTGQISSRLSYTLLHRLNKAITGSSYFDATDYAYLDYHAGRHWTLSGGKQFVCVGGFEYDHSPIDVYRGSEFWNNIQSHQMGLSAAYRFSQDGRQQLLFQLCTNPFYTYEGSNPNTYAYNLMWTGAVGPLRTIYSANLIEYRPHHYISYLALGHQLRLGHRSTLELDYMNRASSGQAYLLRDASVMANLTVDVTPQWQLLAKGTYDVNHSTVADLTVLPGTEISQAGLGVEYRPLRDQRQQLRFHAFCFYAWGKNANPEGALQDRQVLADLGVTWYVHVLRSKR
jgi:hypothetical protein